MSKNKKTKRQNRKFFFETAPKNPHWHRGGHRDLRGDRRLPAPFHVTRQTAIAAPPAVVFPHVNDDFHQWQAWSPWVEKDPNARNTYDGPPAGKGAIFRSGNRNVGEGSMTITESRPSDLVRIDLQFLKPFKGSNLFEFNLKPEGD